MNYSSDKTAAFNPDVWGPHYWFVLNSIAHSYPLYPNEVTKRKYYDFIHNLPLFIPHEKIGNKFGQLLDKFPVTPYLDKKDSFIRWVNFIHNKVNELLDKPTMNLAESEHEYRKQYRPVEDKLFFGHTAEPMFAVYGNTALITGLLITIYLIL